MNMPDRDPFSQEAEQGLLGAMLVRPDLVNVLSADVSEKDFYWSQNREVFRAIMSLSDEGHHVDFMAVAERMLVTGNDDAPDGYTAVLRKATTSVVNAKKYAQIVFDRSVDRALMEAASQIHDLATSDVDSLAKISGAHSLISSVDGTTSSVEVVSASSILDEHVAELERRESLGGAIDGLSTGIELLDRKVQGLKPEQLIVVAGRAKMGKTTFAMGIAAHNAIQDQKNVLVISLEMSNRQLMDRLLSADGGIPLANLRDGSAMRTHPEQLAESSGRIKQSKLMLSDRPGVTMSRARSMARRHQNQHGLDLLVIDHLGLVQGESARMTSVERVSDITRQAKILAKELKVPVLLLAQLNRNLEQRPNKRPIPSDLRESGSIEQDADIIMFVYRDEVYNPHTDDKGVAEIIIGVARDIEACTVRVGYNGKFSKFYDLDSRRAEAPTPMHRPYADRRGMEFD